MMSPLALASSAAQAPASGTGDRPQVPGPWLRLLDAVGAILSFVGPRSSSGLPRAPLLSLALRPCPDRAPPAAAGGE
jgi:hypothetical protein